MADLRPSVYRAPRQSGDGEVTAQSKHSGLGIAAFALGIFNLLALFVLLAVAGYLEGSVPGGLGNNESLAMAVGLVAMLVMALCLLALGLGIGGCVQKQHKKVFAILGIVVSGLTTMIMVGTILLGMSVS